MRISDWSSDVCSSDLHAHAADQRFENEHGHFHTFVRPQGMPPGIRPARVPGFVAPEDADDALSHLVAIAMTPGGLPFRLFTVNRRSEERRVGQECVNTGRLRW